MTSHFEGYVQLGVARFEKYFRRKGWFGFGGDDGTTEVAQADSSGSQAQSEDVMERWQSGEAKYKILVEVALAYAVTKVFLPVRIVGSVWATPWFAGVLLRIRTALTRKP